MSTIPSLLSVPPELINQRPNWAALMFFFQDIRFYDGQTLCRNLNEDTAKFLGQYLYRMVSKATPVAQGEFEDTVTQLFADPRLPRGITHQKLYTLLAKSRGYDGYIDAKETLVKQGQLENKLQIGRAALLQFAPQ